MMFKAVAVAAATAAVIDAVSVEHANMEESLIVAAVSQDEDLDADNENEVQCVATDGTKIYALSSEHMQTNTWSDSGTMTPGTAEAVDATAVKRDPEELWRNKVCSLSNGKVFGMASVSHSTFQSDIQAWDPTTKVWTDFNGADRSNVGNSDVQFEAAMVEADGVLYRIGGGIVQGDPTLGSVSTYGGFASLDTSANTNVWTDLSASLSATGPATSAGTPATSAGTRSPLLAYDKSRNVLVLIGGLISGASWTSDNNLHEYDITSGTWSTPSPLIGSPQVCDVTEDTYEKLQFRRQMVYVEEIRSLVMMQTCAGEAEVTKVFLLDTSVPVKYRKWTIMPAADVETLHKLQARSTLLSLPGGYVMVANGQHPTDTYVPGRAQTVKFTGQEFCNDADIESEHADLVANPKANGGKTLMCAVKKVTPSDLVLSADADGTANNQLKIKWMIPKAFRDAASYGFHMDVIGSGELSDRAAEENCLNLFTHDVLSGTEYSDYSDNVLTFTVSKLSDLQANCDGISAWNANGIVEGEQVFVEFDAKFRLFMYATDDDNPKPQTNAPADVRDNAVIAKTFTARLAYDAETKKVVSVSVFDTDMGTITGTQQTLDSSLAIYDTDCSTQIPYFTAASDACGLNSIDIPGVNVVTSVKAAVQLARILDANGAELQSTADGSLKAHDNSDLNLADTNHVLIDKVGNTLRAQLKFKTPNACFGCQLEVTTKVVEDTSRRLAETVTKAEGEGQDEEKIVVTRSTFDVRPKSATNASKTVGSSSATRSTAAGAALVAMAAGALAA